MNVRNNYDFWMANHRSPMSVFVQLWSDLKNKRVEVEARAPVDRQYPLASPAVGHWGTCLDFQLFIFFVSSVYLGKPTFRMFITETDFTAVLRLRLQRLFMTIFRQLRIQHKTNTHTQTSGVGRILVWRGPHRGAEGARCQRCAPSPENFWLFNLEMAHFDAHLRYSGVLILKFCCAP